MDFLNVLFSRMHHYNILNYLIPGCALCFILHYMGINFFKEDFLVNAVICYLAGLINSRIASLFIEWIAKCTNLIQWRKHVLYSEAKKKNSFIGTLQEENNMYRSFISVFMLSLIAYFVKDNDWVKDNITLILLIFLLFLFLLAYRKQTSYIIQHIDETIGDTDEIGKQSKKAKKCGLLLFIKKIRYGI